MRRIHAIELHEEPWCPSFLRDALTDYLQISIQATRIYQGAGPLISEALTQTKTDRIVDLCSGGGGPWVHLAPELMEKCGPLSIVLTDRNPNRVASERFAAIPQVSYCTTPVDALNVPEELKGFRTLFTSFHHFKPDQAAAIIRDAVRKGEGIAIFESSYRSWTAFFLMLLAPLVILLITPFVRPVRWTSLLFTYLIPITPFLLLWDGWISNLRTYRVEELREMVREHPHYQWKIEELKVRGSALPVTALVGFKAP